MIGQNARGVSRAISNNEQNTSLSLELCENEKCLLAKFDINRDTRILTKTVKPGKQNGKKFPLVDE